MFCAISGEAPEHPVVSIKSGSLFERRLIEKYITDNGKDPINGEEMTVEDLIEVKTTPSTVKPRPPKLSSVPSILSSLQNEWDSVMLESFTLKQQYQQVRQELSHALYQNDAATRVIARLKKERDAAREALANVQAHLGTTATTADVSGDTTAQESMEVDQPALPEQVINQLTETSNTLSQGRRKRKPPTDYTSAESIQTFTETSTIPSMHTSRTPGITAVDVDASGKNILTGGMDKHVQIYNKEEEKVVANLTGHTKKVTAVKFRGQQGVEHDVAISASADKHVRVWIPGGNKGYQVAHNINAHAGEVSSLSVHPSNDYFVSAGLDSKWSFYDFESGQALMETVDQDNQSGYSSIQFHPDGMLLGAGTTDGVVRIWDVKSQSVAANFADHSGQIQALAFSENGYILATASKDNLVKLWDLRKLSNTKTFTLDSDYKVHSLAFDNYGQYLAVGGSDVRILKAKDGSLLSSFTDNSAEITGLKWSPMADSLLAAGMDRTVRFYGAAQE
ncbi:WD40-repeat-containing domain protein [Chlamydoabsidia padenii]|nr:WD40-repeat-containing domain protein [Chlamydoabsidia padenii]